jgi:Domain of unknown function (DUF4326)
MSDYQAHPLRVQRKRTKGYRMPAGVKYVGRGRGKYGRFGNPFDHREYGRADAIALYRQFVQSKPEFIAEIQRELRGKQLACWCPLNEPCHADVLAEIANREPVS